MTNEELLQMYINKVDQDQASIRQEQAAQRQDMAALRQDMRAMEARMDQRMDRIEGTMQSMSHELKEQKRFIVGTVIAAVGAAAAVVSLIMAFV